MLPLTTGPGVQLDGEDATPLHIMLSIHRPAPVNQNYPAKAGVNKLRGNYRKGLAEANPELVLLCHAQTSRTMFKHMSDTECSLNSLGIVDSCIIA